MNEKLYHVVVINNKTGQETIMTAYPVQHKIACILLSKLTRYKWRKETLKEVIN